MPDSDVIEVDLTDAERHLLRCGLLEWHGPARPTNQVAVALGFTDRDDLSTETWRMMKALDEGQSFSRRDWQRVLFCTEVVFASDVVGSGLDWPITTGISDEETIRLLRGLQRRLPRWRGSAQFTVDEGHVVISDPDRQ